MSVWIIEPRDPFIARDGKPFGAIPGARATSLPFPFPSTTTGGVRTRAGLDANGIFASTAEESKKIEVAGPFLVELDEASEIEKWLFPAPADGLLLESAPKDDLKALCKRLIPQAVPAGCVTDLDAAGLSVLQFQEPEKESSKPIQPVRFWYWNQIEKWLTAPEATSLITLSELGHPGPQLEARTHVKLNPETLTAAEGQLFQTQGLEFTHKNQRLGLAVVTTASLKPGFAPLGGERRLVMWRESRTSHIPTKCPEVIRAKILTDECCRVMLTTPGYFEKGFLPTWLCTEREGVTPKLTAIACLRYQTVSGWDFEKNQAKSSSRLAPAGSVYFLSLKGNGQSQIEKWIDATWMRPVSDDEQWRRDGFGVALLGTC